PEDYFWHRGIRRRRQGGRRSAPVGGPAERGLWCRAALLHADRADPARYRTAGATAARRRCAGDLCWPRTGILEGAPLPPPDLARRGAAVAADRVVHGC